VPFLALALSLAAAVSDPPPERPPQFEQRATRFENRWVVLQADDAAAPYRIAFVYVDPTAGFTLNLAGQARFDAGAANWVRLPWELDGKAHVIVRIDGRRNYHVAPLSRTAVAQLGLPEQPDWLTYYEDKRDAVTHLLAWGTFYNHVGEVDLAVGFLEDARKKDPGASGLGFELGYAYNALERYEKALEVLVPAAAAEPDQALLHGEVAYAFSKLGRPPEAIAAFLRAIPLCKDFQAMSKAEFAYNLAFQYQQLGALKERDAWVEKARAWAPEGSALRERLGPPPKPEPAAPKPAPEPPPPTAP